MLHQEITRLNYQLESANESGQEVIGHLQDTAQDASHVINKVEGINSQWDELQGKLQKLQKHLNDQVSLKARVFSFIIFHTFSRSVSGSRCLCHAAVCVTRGVSLWTL